MRPSSKVDPAMAGPTGPVPPGLIILLLSVADEKIIPIRVSLSQAKCVWLNAAVAICQRYRLSEDIALLLNVYTYDFKTFGSVPLGLNRRSKM